MLELLEVLRAAAREPHRASFVVDSHVATLCVGIAVVAVVALVALVANGQQRIVLGDLHDA